MSKRTYQLIVGVVGGVVAIAGAVVAYLQPAYTSQTILALGIGNTAVTEILSLFTKQEDGK